MANTLGGQPWFENIKEQVEDAEKQSENKAPDELGSEPDVFAPTDVFNDADGETADIEYTLGSKPTTYADH